MKRQVTEYECDACGKRQAGELTDNVFGLTGMVEEHDRGGGVAGVEWFACSRPCVSTAIFKAINQAIVGPDEI